MKAYEHAEAGRRLMPLVPAVARLDGKGFSKFTKGLTRPYDPRLSQLMVDMTIELVAQTNACIGYTQSDEITLIWFSDDPKRQIYFDGRIHKLVSVLAATASVFFNTHLAAKIPEKAGTCPVFDCRLFSLPNRREAANVLLWRERDATRNSLSMAARAHYSHNKLHQQGHQQMHDLLMAKGINWNDYPAFFKRGTYVQSKTVLRPFTPEELEVLPPRHEARTNPQLQIERRVVAPIDMPPFSRVTNRVEVVFDGATPQTETVETEQAAT